jgi:PIN domain nuclease of toxin-antitoxin system
LRILLDTHLLLWWLEASPSLSAQAREMICDPQNTVFVSAVSLWEIWLKQSLGKLRLPVDFTERLAAESFESLPLMASQTRQVSLLPWCHRDPFDRMLVAQAQVEKTRPAHRRPGSCGLWRSRSPGSLTSEWLIARVAAVLHIYHHQDHLELQAFRAGFGP